MGIAMVINTAAINEVDAVYRSYREITATSWLIEETLPTRRLDQHGGWLLGHWPLIAPIQRIEEWGTQQDGTVSMHVFPRTEGVSSAAYRTLVRLPPTHLVAPGFPKLLVDTGAAE